jgi:hypothetical protein
MNSGNGIPVVNPGGQFPIYCNERVLADRAEHFHPGNQIKQIETRLDAIEAELEAQG